ncbi:hypothetical protein NX059_005106 [Plenodomus lindquistii]|nr:hypothetical protein NX059_005106 [Plenodomus lindquistii]
MAHPNPDPAWANAAGFDDTHPHSYAYTCEVPPHSPRTSHSHPDSHSSTPSNAPADSNESSESDKNENNTLPFPAYPKRDWHEAKLAGKKRDEEREARECHGDACPCQEAQECRKCCHCDGCVRYFECFGGEERGGDAGDGEGKEDEGRDFWKDGEGREGR